MTDRRRARKRTVDGFTNFAANLGLQADNLLARGSYVPGRYVTRSRTELEDMYRTSWVVGRMVEVVAEDMTRSAIDIQGTMDQDEVAQLQRAYLTTGIPGRLTDAIKWGRLYGGAIAVILIDGHRLSDPLEMDSITKGSFRGLFVLDRHQVVPSTQTISELGPMLGYPSYYTLHNPDAQFGSVVHHSRVLRFIGVDLPGDLRRSEQYWGASVAERAYDRILALDSATHGGANLLYKSFLRVIGVDRYREILAAGGQAEKALLKMFTFIRQMQSNEGITLLDKNDTFTPHNWSFSGMYDALQAFCEQLAGATGIPLVRLLGQSPKGFSTGDADLRTYYDTILTQINDDRRPVDTVLFGVLSRHLWARPLPNDFAFDYQGLYVPTEVERSQIASNDAQGAAALHASNVITRRQALEALKDGGQRTGRFSFISESDLEQADREDMAPPLPEGILPPVE